jgi:hypothetical protein
MKKKRKLQERTNVFVLFSFWTKPRMEITKARSAHRGKQKLSNPTSSPPLDPNPTPYYIWVVLVSWLAVNLIACKLLVVLLSWIELNLDTQKGPTCSSLSQLLKSAAAAAAIDNSQFASEIKFREEKKSSACANEGESQRTGEWVCADSELISDVSRMKQL